MQPLAFKRATLRQFPRLDYLIDEFCNRPTAGPICKQCAIGTVLNRVPEMPPNRACGRCVANAKPQPKRFPERMLIVRHAFFIRNFAQLVGYVSEEPAQVFVLVGAYLPEHVALIGTNG